MTGGIEPLTIILFCGNSPISIAIRFVEELSVGNSTISHTGTVVTRELLPHVKQLEYGELYILESTISYSLLTNSNPGDVLTGKGKMGVQIRKFNDVVSTYNGRMFYMNPKDNCYFKDSVGTRLKMKNLLDKYQSYGYEITFLTQIAAAFKVLLPLTRRLKEVKDEANWKLSEIQLPGLKTVFCSELTSIICQELGYLKLDINPNEVMPIDFLLWQLEGKIEFTSPKIIFGPV